MSLNPLKLLDIMSMLVYSYLRTSPGHCRDTKTGDHGAKCKGKETRNASGPPEAPGGQEARVREDWPARWSRIPPQPDGRHLGPARGGWQGWQLDEGDRERRRF